MWSISAASVANKFKAEMEKDFSNFLNQPVSITFTNQTTCYRLRVEATTGSYYGRQDLFNFNLECFPGTCGILISDHTYVYEGFKHKGIGTKLMEWKIEIGKWRNYGSSDMNFSQLMCVTVDPKNDRSAIYEERILNKFEFKLLETFVNMRGGNTCKIWIKQLQGVEE